MSQKNSGKKQQEEPVYEVQTPLQQQQLPLPQIIAQTQQPQLAPLGRRNIVKVDPNLVRQAIREKAVIPTRQVTQKEVFTITSVQEIINNYVLILTKDLKSGSMQFYGTPYNVDEMFRTLISVLADRFSSIAIDELSTKFTEIQNMINSDADYENIIAKLNEAHMLTVLLLLSFERSIMEVAGVSSSKMLVEVMSPLEIAQVLGITPVRTDKL